jgi:hypothetical protein
MNAALAASELPTGDPSDSSSGAHSLLCLIEQCLVERLSDNEALLEATTTARGAGPERERVAAAWT